MAIVRNILEALAAAVGVPSKTNPYVLSNDARLTDTRDPKAHASTHASAGSDPVTPAAIGASAIGHTHTHASTTGKLGSGDYHLSQQAALIAEAAAAGTMLISLTNKTGAPSVKGSLVQTSASTDLAFELNSADDNDTVGVVYEDGVVDGEACLVVIAGKAQVLLQDSTASTRGYWVRTSITVAGRADATNPAPPGAGITEADRHFKEIGHCLESVTAGTNKLAWCIVHFN